MNLEEARQEKSFTLDMRVFSPDGEQPPGVLPAVAQGSGCCRLWKTWHERSLNQPRPALPAGDMVSCSLPALKPNTSRMSGECLPQRPCSVSVSACVCGSLCLCRG